MSGAIAAFIRRHPGLVLCLPLWCVVMKSASGSATDTLCQERPPLASPGVGVDTRSHYKFINVPDVATGSE